MMASWRKGALTHSKVAVLMVRSPVHPSAEAGAVTRRLSKSPKALAVDLILIPLWQDTSKHLISSTGSGPGALSVLDLFRLWFFAVEGLGAGMLSSALRFDCMPRASAS
jgi:hypothetical protein